MSIIPMLNIPILINPKFPLGRLVITANANSRLEPAAVEEGILRHAAGDWGELGCVDAELNESGLEDGEGLTSVYGTEDGRFWIITEGDRSVTTVLMPDDY